MSIDNIVGKWSGSFLYTIPEASIPVVATRFDLEIVLTTDSLFNGSCIDFEDDDLQESKIQGMAENDSIWFRKTYPQFYYWEDDLRLTTLDELLRSKGINPSDHFFPENTLSYRGELTSADEFSGTWLYPAKKFHIYGRQFWELPMSQGVWSMERI